MKQIGVYTFAVLCVWLCSCTKRFEANRPVYIKIDSIGLSTVYAKEGTRSNAIQDAWLFINDDLQGVYKLPAHVPILSSGSTNIKIFGGVNKNGIDRQSLRYLFYNAFEINQNLLQESTYVFNPTLTYLADAAFSFKEDFEGIGIAFDKTTKADTGMYLTTDALEGRASGAFYLDSSQTKFEVSTGNLRRVLTFKNPIFLEMDYKATNNITVGVVVNSTLVPAVLIGATNDWKKIYLDLSPAFLENKSAADIRLFLGVQNTSSDVATGMFDNIKIVHF